MTVRLAALARSPRVRALFSYPFRLEGPASEWKSTPFAGLAIVNNLSGAGDALITVALAGSVFVSVSLSAARGRTALGLVITVLPFAVVGPFVGPVIDRMRGGRRVVVLIAALGRLAACLMMASWIHSLLLFPAAFVSLVCSKTHAVASSSLVPGVVEHDADLVRANSRLAVGSSLSTSAAALVGSGVYKLLGSRILLDLDVLVFAAVAAVSLHLLARQARPSLAGPGDVPAAGAVAGGRSAARPGWLRGRPKPFVSRELRLAQVAMAGMRASAGLLTALVVFGFRRQGAPVVWYGLVGLASIGGNFGGALAAPRLRQRVAERRLVGGAALLIGGTAIAVLRMGEMQRRPAALILAAVVALGASSAKTAFDAIVQRSTRDADRSRLFARFGSIFQLVWVLGALVPTLVYTPLLAGFVLTAVIVVSTSGVFVVGMARRPAALLSPPGPSGPTPPRL